MKDKGSLNAWLQLVRPPNLVTVIGDPLAGFLLVVVSVPYIETVSLLSVWPCLVASLLIYMSGLLLNDWADVREDKRDRPERPIPSGKVHPRAVLMAGVILMTSGVGIASLAGAFSLAIASCIGILVLLYNAAAKQIRPVGALVMGLCRGMSLFLGSAAAGYSSPLVVIAVIGLTFYIMEVSNLAAGEVEGKVSKVSRWFPAGVLLVMYLCFYYRLGSFEPVSMSLAVVAVGWGIARAVALGKAEKMEDVARQIGLLLRGLLIVQASFCAVAGRPGLIAAGCLLLLWPIGIVLARKFYAS